MTEYEVCQQNTMACEQEIAKGIIGQKDVIRQHQIGKNRSFFKPECTFLLFFYDDVGTGHVTRHQIRGKLDSLETQITHLADRAHQHGLSQSRHTF